MATKRRSFTLEGIDEGQRRVHVVASTSDPVKGFDDKGEPRLESLRGWQLERFIANPVILWSHEADKPPIGRGVDIKPTADGGLELWIQFPFANERNARAEEIWDLVRTKQVRGISVGFDYGAQSQEGDVVVFTGNELAEVSVVTVPADSGALVSQEPTVATEPTPEEAEAARRAKASEAGRALSMHRYGRSDADEAVQRFDVMGRTGRVRRTQVGGVRVDARLTRVGVLPYTLADGSVRRELRHPDEVFNADSLATLQSAPVTDLAHHRALIGPHNWKEANLGHTENIRTDARYVEGELVINDAATAADVENAKLSDISCGYECKLDFTPGVFEGERYDAIQRLIRYNHVAVLPKGRGRAGTDVGVRLDSSDAFSVADNESETTMVKTIRLDGKDFEVGSDAHLTKIDEMHSASLSKFKADAAEELNATKAKLDTLQANFDATSKAKKGLEEELEAEKGEKGKARVRARLRLLQRAAKFLTDDDEDEDKFDGLSDREVMVKVINSDANWKEEKFDGKSDDYVQALFDSVTKNFTRADGVDSVVKAHQVLTRSDVADDVVSKAEAAQRTKNQDRWKQPLSATKS